MCRTPSRTYRVTPSRPSSRAAVRGSARTAARWWRAGAIMNAVSDWERVSPWTAREVVAGALFGVGCAFAAVVTAKLLTARGHWQVNPVVGGLAVYGFLGVWLTMMWRMMRTGLYTGQVAVRIRGPFRTRTVAWSQIAGVDAAPALVLGAPTARKAIWLTLTDGRRVETPVQRRIGRLAFGWRKNVGPVLDGEDFDRLVRQLRQRSQTP